MQSIELVSVELKDFMSFEHEVFTIEQNQVTSLKGINNDDESTESNGSGKSALLEALYYSLTGNSLRANSSKDFVRREGGNLGEVESKFIKNNKQILHIKREVRKKGTSRVHIYVDDVIQEDLIDLHPRESNKFILDWIGLSFNDLINTYITHKEKYKSFLAMSDREKKEFISRFCGLESIDSTIELIESDIEEVKLDKLPELETELSKSKGSIETLQEQLEGVDQSFENKEQSVKERIEEQNVRLDKVKDMEVHLDEQCKEKEVEVERLKKQSFSLIQCKESLEKEKSKKDDELEELMDLLISLREEKNEKADQYVKKIDEQQTKLNQTYSLKSELQTKLKGLEGELKHFVSCPKCEHEFIPNEKKRDIEEVEGEIEDISKEIDSKTKVEKSIDVKISNLREKKESIESEFEEDISFVKGNITSMRESIASTYQDVKKKESEVYSLEKELEGLNREVDQLKNREDKRTPIVSKIKELENLIESYKEDKKNSKKELKEKIEDLNTKVKGIDKDIESENSEIILLHDSIEVFKSFKTHLINKFLFSIENSANSLLKEMRTPIRIKIEGYKKLKSGDIREKIEIKSLRDNVTEEDISMLSSGEKSKVDMALMFARQEMITQSTQSDLNLLWVDEVCESLDTLAMSNLIKSLNKLSKTCIITTHSHPIEAIECNRVTVEKTNGVSQINS